MALYHWILPGWSVTGTKQLWVSFSQTGLITGSKLRKLTKSSGIFISFPCPSQKKSKSAGVFFNGLELLPQNYFVPKKWAREQQCKVTAYLKSEFSLITFIWFLSENGRWSEDPYPFRMGMKITFFMNIWPYIALRNIQDTWWKMSSFKDKLLLHQKRGKDPKTALR